MLGKHLIEMGGGIEIAMVNHQHLVGRGWNSDLFLNCFLWQNDLSCPEKILES